MCSLIDQGENFIVICTQERNLGTKSRNRLVFASRAPGTPDWPHLYKGSCNPVISYISGNIWHCLLS